MKLSTPYQYPEVKDEQLYQYSRNVCSLAHTTLHSSDALPHLPSALLASECHLYRLNPILHLNLDLDLGLNLKLRSIIGEVAAFRNPLETWTLAIIEKELLYVHEDGPALYGNDLRRVCRIVSIVTYCMRLCALPR